MMITVVVYDQIRHGILGYRTGAATQTKSNRNTFLPEESWKKIKMTRQGTFFKSVELLCSLRKLVEL